jgi:TonB family protein
MINKTIYFLLFFCCISIYSQNSISYKGEEINALDDNNLQTGIWKLYDDENNNIIETEFKNGKIIGDTKFYKNLKLIAAYNNYDELTIYKGSDTIKAHFFRKADKNYILIDQNGKELDKEISNYSYLTGLVMPFYYGGNSKMYEFIGNNIDYNKIKKNTGKVMVKFSINAKGQSSNIEIIESTNPELNEEVIRVVSILPRWQPGYQNGAFVNCFYTIPVKIN